jgi:hypothetical protein
MTAIAVYAVEAPQRIFPHYLQLLVFPVAGLTGSLLGVAVRSLQRFKFTRSHAAQLALGTLVVAFAVAPAIVVSLRQGNAYVGAVPSSNGPPWDIYRALRATVRPGERVAIWGWMPQYLVAADADMGTRDSITQFQISTRRLAGYYRARYLADMRENSPKYFLDTVAPSSFAFTDRATQGLESFPELDDLVTASYTLVFDIDGVRLYRRNT